MEHSNPRSSKGFSPKSKASKYSQNRSQKPSQTFQHRNMLPSENVYSDQFSQCLPTQCSNPNMVHSQPSQSVELSFQMNMLLNPKFPEYLRSQANQNEASPIQTNVHGCAFPCPPNSYSSNYQNRNQIPASTNVPQQKFMPKTSEGETNNFNSGHKSGYYKKLNWKNFGNKGYPQTFKKCPESQKNKLIPRKAKGLSWNKIFCESFEFGTFFAQNQMQQSSEPNTFYSYFKQTPQDNKDVWLSYPPLAGKTSKKIQLNFQNKRIEFAFNLCETIFLKEEAGGSILYFQLSCIPRFEEKLPHDKDLSRALSFIFPSKPERLLKECLSRSTVIKVSFRSDETKNVINFLERDKIRDIYQNLKDRKIWSKNMSLENWDFKYYLTYKKLNGLKLSFQTKFALLVCISHKKIGLFEITKEIIENIQKLDPEIVIKTLIDISKSPRKFDSFKEENHTPPLRELFNELYTKNKNTASGWKSSMSEKSKHYCKVKTVTITPTVVNYSFGEYSLSNGVIRRYGNDDDNFIRVNFSDEIGKGLKKMDLIIEKRFKTLARQLTILDRTYNFLAYSASQLRNSAMWMFADSESLTVESIRRELGDFSSIKTPAKNGARRGQLFSASLLSLNLDKEVKVIEVNDVKTECENYVFSDGVGKISRNLMEKIKEKLKFAGQLCAIQVRLGGVKGVLVMDPSLEDNVIVIRDSMQKFYNSSFDRTLDVLDYNTFHSAYLNKQIIVLLLANRLRREEVLIDLQIETFEESIRMHSKDLLSHIVDNPLAPVKSLVRSCVTKKINMNEEPFLNGVITSIKVQTFASRCISDPKLLVKEGALLIGVLDEWNVLKPGEIFVCISPSNGENKSDIKYISGDMVVTKAPCLHSGDIRVLKGVDNEEAIKKLGHLVNCIVFPAIGDRPHTNEIAGSDLDGDKYFVSWDERLIPLIISKPMCYDAPKLQEQDTVTTADIIDFFFEFAVNDDLGTIDHAHLALADYCLGRGEDLCETCQILAVLHSIAVDYAKTGIPPDLRLVNFPKKFPAHMGKESNKTEKSNSILERIWRRMKKEVKHTEMHKVYKEGIKTSSDAIKIDKRMVVDGFQDYLAVAFNALETYYQETSYFMSKYGIRSEFEVYSGSFPKLEKNSKYHHKNPGDMAQLHEKTIAHINEINNIVKQAAKSKISEKQVPKNIGLAMQQLASAFYIAAYYNENCQDADINNAMQEINYDREIKPKFAKYKQQMIGLPWYIFKDRILNNICENLENVV